jgi:hypothetical protein
MPACRQDPTPLSHVFTIDQAQARVETVADDLMQLVSNLRALLPEGPSADVTGPIEDLSQGIRDAVAESRVERARGAIMDHGLPLDDVHPFIRRWQEVTPRPVETFEQLDELLVTLNASVGRS